MTDESVKLKQYKNDRVVLSCHRRLLMSLVLDAAREQARHKCRPEEEELLALAEALAEHEQIHYPESGSCELLKDVERALAAGKDA